MQFLVVLLRLLVERFVADRQDGLTMAARSDGRIQQAPGRWSQWLEQCCRWMQASAWRRENATSVRWSGDGARWRQRRTD